MKTIPMNLIPFSHPLFHPSQEPSPNKIIWNLFILVFLYSSVSHSILLLVVIVFSKFETNTTARASSIFLFLSFFLSFFLSLGFLCLARMGEGMKNSESFSSDSDDSILSSSSELTEEEDDTASSSIGPLFELSSLMEQLPIKRGLSKYYQGKSQSFTSLSNVRCLEDLPKKETPYQKKKMKASKSCGGGLDLGQKPLNYSLGPCNKAYINKKSGGLRRSSGNFLFCNKPPHPPPHSSLHKNL